MIDGKVKTVKEGEWWWEKVWWDEGKRDRRFSNEVGPELTCIFTNVFHIKYKQIFNISIYIVFFNSIHVFT